MVMDSKKLITRFLPWILGIVVIFVIMVVFLVVMHSTKSTVLEKLQAMELLITDQHALKKELKYVEDASKIIDYYYKEKICMRFCTVRDMLKAIDQYLSSYFPDGPFTRRDFIALALTETSNLNQYTTGSCGEYGLFQIMPEMCKAKNIKRNHFDIFVNTELAMFVMDVKYKQHKDYYKAIIAYNGVIIDNRTKRWRDKYWKRFLNYRKDVDVIFGGSND
jgi:hypothetical protein